MASHIQEHFSPNELHEFHEIFEMFDKDGGGSIDAEELESLLHSLGKFPSTEEVEKLLLMVDADGSGEVDFEEFLELLIMLENSGGGHSEQQLRDWFSKIDVGGKGVVEPADLFQFMAQLSDTGGICLTDLEDDPDKAVSDRTIDWSEEMNKIMIDAKSLLGEQVRKDEKTHLYGITFENFCTIVEELDI